MRTILVIHCPKCKGVCWEEQMPDTDKFIDIVCIICGLRRFYPKVKYMQWRRKMEKRANTRRILPA